MRFSKRHIILVFALLLAASSLQAQRLGGGLILGPTLSTMKMSAIDTTSFRFDFCGGVRLAIIPEHSVFGAEVDVIYSRQGMRTPQGVDDMGNKFRIIEKSNYISVPVLLNVYFRRWSEDDEDESDFVRLRVGPQVGFCLGGSEVVSTKENKQTKNYIVPWAKGSYNWLDYGVTAAVSYWFIEVRYTMGMNNVFKGEGWSFNHVISVTWSDIW